MFWFTFFPVYVHIGKRTSHDCTFMCIRCSCSFWLFLLKHMIFSWVILHKISNGAVTGSFWSQNFKWTYSTWICNCIGLSWFGSSNIFLSMLHLTVNHKVTHPVANKFQTSFLPQNPWISMGSPRASFLSFRNRIKNHRLSKHKNKIVKREKGVGTSKK